MVAARHQTKLARHAASATQVFETPELLEMILLLVGTHNLRTVFFSRRVNKTFKATIEWSVPLQKALYMRRDAPLPPIEPGKPWLILNPLFDITGLPRQPPRYIEAFVFSSGDYVLEGVDWEGGQIWCEDAILDMKEGPLLDMMISARREARHSGRDVSLLFRLRKRGDDGPEAVRLRLDFGEWRWITVRKVIEKARVKLREWYPETYGDV